jgi:hypothetical protein
MNGLEQIIYYMFFGGKIFNKRKGETKTPSPQLSFKKLSLSLISTDRGSGGRSRNVTIITLVRLFSIFNNNNKKLKIYVDFL